VRDPRRRLSTLGSPLRRSRTAVTGPPGMRHQQAGLSHRSDHRSDPRLMGASPPYFAGLASARRGDFFTSGEASRALRWIKSWCGDGGSGRIRCAYGARAPRGRDRSGNGNATEFVEAPPFLRARREMRSVPGHSTKAKIADAPLEPRANQPAHLTQAVATEGPGVIEASARALTRRRFPA
jgi:hypothetical protein